jgi:hypothetical protein
MLAHMTRPDTSFGAVGSDKFVATATAVAVIGGAIGTAVHDGEIYDDCMEMRGWRIADAATPAPLLVSSAQQVQPAAPVIASTLSTQTPAEPEAPHPEPTLVRLRYAQ